jgi:hypothetical protein
MEYMSKFQRTGRRKDCDGNENVNGEEPEKTNKNAERPRSGWQSR